jgi:hypothetical protein
MSVRAGDPSAPVRDASPLNGAAGGAPDPLRAAVEQL